MRKEDAQAPDDFDADAFDRKLEEGEMEPKPFWPIVVAALMLIIAVASSIVSVARTLGWLGSYLQILHLCNRPSINPKPSCQPRRNQPRPSSNEHIGAFSIAAASAVNAGIRACRPGHKVSRRSVSKATAKPGRGTTGPGEAFNLPPPRHPYPHRSLVPTCPAKRTGNVDDVIAGGRRILLRPGNPKPDPVVDPPASIAKRQMVKRNRWGAKLGSDAYVERRG